MMAMNAHFFRAPTAYAGRILFSACTAPKFQVEGVHHQTRRGSTLPSSLAREVLQRAPYVVFAKQAPAEEPAGDLVSRHPVQRYDVDVDFMVSEWQAGSSFLVCYIVHRVDGVQ